MSASPGGGRDDEVNILSQYVCWEKQQSLPTNVCFVEEKEGAQRVQTGRRGVNDFPHRRAAAATFQRTVDAAGGTKNTFNISTQPPAKATTLKCYHSDKCCFGSIKSPKPFTLTHQFAMFPSSWSDSTGSQTMTSSVTSAGGQAFSSD